jgi:hypothetical protein
VAKYLVDANLPYYFRLWNNPDFIHVKDIDDSFILKIWEWLRIKLKIIA